MLAATGQFDLARRQYETALALRPDMELARRALARLDRQQQSPGHAGSRERTGIDGQELAIDALARSIPRSNPPQPRSARFRRPDQLDAPARCASTRGADQPARLAAPAGDDPVDLSSMPHRRRLKPTASEIASRTDVLDSSGFRPEPQSARTRSYLAGLLAAAASGGLGAACREDLEVARHHALGAVELGPVVRTGGSRELLEHLGVRVVGRADDDRSADGLAVDLEVDDVVLLSFQCDGIRGKRPDLLALDRDR